MTQIETRVDRFVRNCWYVAGWEDEISGDGLLERTLLGDSIVFYRASDGRLVALDNRCCHRGAPLHTGRREGDSLRCPYHGMLFNAEGQCIEIPGQDMIPQRACVRSYPVVARDELIWIWMGEPAKADPDKIIRFERWHRQGVAQEARLSAPSGRLHAHRRQSARLLAPDLRRSTTIGTPSTATTRAVVEQIEGGLKITRRDYNDMIQANRRQYRHLPRPGDRWQIYEWFAPSFVRLYTGSAPAGTGAHEGQLVPEAMQYRHCSVQTPETSTPPTTGSRMRRTSKPKPRR